MAEKEKRKKFTKSNLPAKICETCQKPFAWRKRWEKVWAQVKYCSEKCRRGKNRAERRHPDDDERDNAKTLLET